MIILGLDRVVLRTFCDVLVSALIVSIIVAVGNTGMNSLTSSCESTTAEGPARDMVSTLDMSSHEYES